MPAILPAINIDAPNRKLSRYFHPYQLRWIHDASAIETLLGLALWPPELMRKPFPPDPASFLKTPCAAASSPAARTAPSPDAVFIRLNPTKTDHTDYK
jgi:hypothetical protein